MNLLNLETLTWDPSIAEATATELMAKLPRVVPVPGQAGGLSPYFTKYGLSPGIPVAVWTGDNPASLIGSGAIRQKTAVISLGTSDTFFAALDSFRVDPKGFGHVFGHPAGGFMSLTCFKNGSLARERVRREAGVGWAFFDKEAFEMTPAGNDGQWALPWFEPEITPLVTKPGLRANFNFANASPDVRIRAVVEAQAMALYTHSLWMGDFSVIRVTGGASQSAGILQTLADVFGATLEIFSTTDSAALGAAMIAAHVGTGMSYDSLSATYSPSIRSITPREEAVKIYRKNLHTFPQFSTEVL